MSPYFSYVILVAKALRYCLRTSHHKACDFPQDIKLDMPRDIITKTFKCNNCGHGWRPMLWLLPKTCPKCLSPDWDNPKKKQAWRKANWFGQNSRAEPWWISQPLRSAVSSSNFISIRRVYRSVSKFTVAQRSLVKTIVATLSIKRIPESEIIDEIFRQTNKTLSSSMLYRIKQSIKKESYHWYKTMREGEYEYIHEFKERIDEILWLQRKHHTIIDCTDNPSVQQISLAELHRLNITLSNYFDVASDIIGHTVSTTPETKEETRANNFIV